MKCIRRARENSLLVVFVRYLFLEWDLIRKYWNNNLVTNRWNFRSVGETTVRYFPSSVNRVKTLAIFRRGSFSFFDISQSSRGKRNHNRTGRWTVFDFHLPIAYIRVLIFSFYRRCTVSSMNTGVHVQRTLRILSKKLYRDWNINRTVLTRRYVERIE